MSSALPVYSGGVARENRARRQWARTRPLWSWALRLNRRDGIFLGLLTLIAVTGGVLSLLWASYADAQLIRQIARNAALQWADHLVAHIDLEKLVSGRINPRQLRRSLNFAGSIGDIYRYRIYNAEGRVIAASRQREIGKQDRPALTAASGARGIEVVTHLNQGRRLIADYAEVFIPFIRDGTPIGAVLVNIDLTQHVAAHRSGFRVMIIGVIIALVTSSLLAGYIIVRNMLDREANIRRLRRARDDANRANRTKSEFLANMSHELRTPLNAILGFSDILHSEAFGPLGNERYIDYSRDINESGQHLLSLINDILDLAKIESGKGEIEEEPVDVAELIGQVAVLVRDRAHEGKISLDLDTALFDGDIMVDQRKMKQVLVNLLSNAVKFTEPGGQIVVSARELPGKFFLLEVSDTGIGMAPEDIPRALTSFQQVDSHLDRRYEGTGLGLPLAKALVEMHGGTLIIESVKGNGTTVSARLPCERIIRRAVPA